MTRDILDSEGNIIGQLTLPDETTEEEWTRRLDEFKYTAPVPTDEELIIAQMKAMTDFGNKMLEELAVENIRMGIFQSGKLKQIIDYTMSLQLYLSTGALQAAIDEIDLLIAAGLPEDLAPFVTLERMNANRAKLAGFIGVK